MTSRSVEQEATVTFASALRERSIGAVASISSNPSAKQGENGGCHNKKNMQLIFGFLGIGRFLGFFLGGGRRGRI